MEIVMLRHQQQLMAGSPGYGGSTTDTSGNLSRGYYYEDNEE